MLEKLKFGERLKKTEKQKDRMKEIMIIRWRWSGTIEL